MPFVMQGVVPPEISTMDIYKSVTPFILLDCIASQFYLVSPDRNHFTEPHDPLKQQGVRIEREFDIDDFSGEK